MRPSSKKVLPALLITAASSTPLLHAEVSDSAQMRSLDNRVTALEQRRGAGGMINPSARPQIKGGADLFIIADFLVWEAHENGLPIAIESQTNNSLTHGKVENLDFEWDFGFRVGAGYNLPHDGWDVRLIWLWFNTDADANKHASSSEYLFPSRAHPADSLSSVLRADLSIGRWS